MFGQRSNQRDGNRGPFRGSRGGRGRSSNFRSNTHQRKLARLEELVEVLLLWLHNLRNGPEYLQGHEGLRNALAAQTRTADVDNIMLQMRNIFAPPQTNINGTDAMGNNGLVQILSEMNQNIRTALAQQGQPQQQQQQQQQQQNPQDEDMLASDAEEEI